MFRRLDAGGMDITDLPVKYDEKFADRLRRMSWSRSMQGYARHAYSEGGRVRWVSMHRLVWAWEYGESNVPRYIDHINGDRMDNRLCNLRAATLSLNAHNTVRRKRKSLPNGVYRNRGSGVSPYGACIGYGNKAVYLGVFATVSEASAAYEEAKRRIIEHEAMVAAGAAEGSAELPVVRRQRGRPKRMEAALARSLFDSGKTLAAVAAELACCIDTARRLLRESGLRFKPGRPKKGAAR